MRPSIDPQYKFFLRFSVLHDRSIQKHAAYHAIKSDALVLVAAFTLFLVILYSEGANGGIDWGSLNPASGLIEMRIVAFLGWLVLFLKRWLLNYLEDDVKLSDDYNHLIELYLPKDETPAEEGFVTFDNPKASNAIMRLLIYEYTELTPGTKRYGTVAETVFPVVCSDQCICQPVDSITIIDSREAYEPPVIIQANFTKIISAHQESHMHDQTVIRVDDWSCTDGRLSLRTSRSTYFNSAVTNRAMDYDFGEVTVRKLFEYGPRVSPLNASKLSNHLGYNAFVITADGYVPFVIRSKELSIGKLTLGCSIGASVKSKYALGEESGEFSPAGLLNSVTCEIEDELKVEPSEIIGTPQIIAPYRDLLEGGKPQLCICAHTSLDHRTLGKKFRRIVSKKPRGGLSPDAELLEDGRAIEWASTKDLEEAAVAPGFLFFAGKKYAMLPSMTASVALLIKSGI